MHSYIKDMFLPSYIDHDGGMIKSHQGLIELPRLDKPLVSLHVQNLSSNSCLSIKSQLTQSTCRLICLLIN